MEFDRPYNRDQALRFLSDELLPDDFIQSHEAIDERIVKLGASSSLNLVVYEIGHRSEHDPRITLSRESFRLLASYGQERALVFFTSPKSENYRLSLITIGFKEAKGGRTRREYSNPRRYSFFLGPAAKINTPTRLLRDRVQDFPDLQKRFSIEVVNKEFYAEIASLFTELACSSHKIGETGSLSLPSITEKALARKEFAVRLIGRLVFCWFLKKKLSEKGRSLIPEEILGSGAIAKNQGYYHAVLEPLFFETLNTPVENRKGKFRARPWSDIPFLNGGLFDPHKGPHGDFYEVGAMDYSVHANSLKVPDEWLRKLMKTFELYNFTVDENTSVDIELSIDPEMLGRIFENLLAEINPETGESARKATGSYYTPRVIVDYMVDESLKSFLKTRASLTEEECAELLSFSDEGTSLGDEKAAAVVSALGNIRIIDPACGSGAFPMGILQKILFILQKVDPESKRWKEKVLAGVKDNLLKKKLEKENLNYIFKLGIIRDSIYGVDIQPIAMEISKLRFFLSLIVDEKIDDSRDNRGIQPLPNLEFKFVCADSLIPLLNFQGEQYLLGGILDNDPIKRLKALRDNYFTSHGEEKRELEGQFRKTQDDLLNKDTAFTDQYPPLLTQSLALWEPFDNKMAPWFDPEWMFGVRDGFDIVIANPPYIRQEDIKEKKQKLQSHYECYVGTADYFVYFFERGFNLLKENGALAFITSNKYFRSGYGEKLRGFLSRKASLGHVIDFGDAPVFEAIAYPSIVVLTRQTPKPDAQVRALSWRPDASIEDFPSIFEKTNLLIAQSEMTANGWRLESSAVLRLMEKLRKAGKPLGEYVHGRFYRGILTGLNEAFVVDRATRDRLIKEHKSSAAILKPFLRGRDVKRWKVQFDDYYLIKIESSENQRHPWSGHSDKDAETIFAKTYPAIHAHMDNLRKDLIKRDDQGKYFWELRSCAYWQEFEQPKIVYPNICQRNEFAWDSESYYVNQKAFIIPAASKFLLGVLNSSVVMWLFEKFLAKLQNGYYEPSSIFIKYFPIPNTRNSNDIEPFISQILAVKSRDAEADVSAIEREIDQRVYRLYGLTKEEIKIIEDGR